MSTLYGSSSKLLSYFWFRSLSHSLHIQFFRKIALPFPSKYMIYLTTSHCRHCYLFLRLTLNSFFSGFPHATLVPYIPQCKSQSEPSYILYSKSFCGSPFLLKSKVLAKDCKAYTIWPYITFLNSSLTISSSFTLLQAHGPPSLHMPCVFLT